MLFLLLAALLLVPAATRLACPSYDELADEFAAHLSPSTYQGLWYEAYSHNVFLVDSCHCTRYNFTLRTDNTFTDVFTCHKNAADGKIFTVPNDGRYDTTTPGKMVESLGPAHPPYWVLGLWNEHGVLMTSASSKNEPYAFALVYACVGSPLLGEYTYFFSRNDTIPALVYKEMRTFALERNISLSSVRKVPMDGCKW